MKEQEVLKKGLAPKGRPRARVAWPPGGFREKNQQDAAPAPAPSKLVKKDRNLNSRDRNAQRQEQENTLGRWLGSLSTVPCPLGPLSTTRPHVSPLCRVGRGQKAARIWVEENTSKCWAFTGGFKSRWSCSCGRNFSQLLTKNGLGDVTF